MAKRHLTADDLTDKVIDGHSHIGISLKSYACREYPYAQTIEGLYYRQRSACVDVNIVFPVADSLFSSLAYLGEGERLPAENLPSAPYALENEMMMLEIFHFAPEHMARFIPFVMVDPGRAVAEQIRALHKLEQRFPVYGVKISPVACQSKITSLLDVGKPILDYAAERNIPLLLHTTTDPLEAYSHATLCFQVIERNPHLRFCLAHCIGFHAAFLHKANDMPNVWVDTAALAIQVQCARENSRIMASEKERFAGDYSDHKQIMRALMDHFPDTILWGTDSPWYTFICRRKQGEGSTLQFNLKASYEDEKAALDFLPAAHRTKACNSNTLKFLFGDSPE